MTWDLMWLIVHVGLFIMCMTILKQAPDQIQKFVVGLIMLSALVLAGYYLARTMGVYFSDDAAIKAGALTFEHIGVILYMVRVTLKEKGICKNSLPHGQ